MVVVTGDRLEYAGEAERSYIYAENADRRR